MAVRPWNIASLCAGVGGLDLGIRIAEPGAHGVVFVEREAAAAAVLVARMEAGDIAPAPVWSDLATFDARPWRGVVDCVTSGDPCQPNSVAGKRGGADDERFLIDQVLRVVAECRPDRLFRENVPGNADGQLAALIPTLEGLGYRCAVGLFSAAEVGASHRRERLFVMADRAGEPGWLHEGQGRSCGRAADAGGRGGPMDDAQCPEWRALGHSCGDHGPNGDAQRPEGADRVGTSDAAVADPGNPRSPRAGCDTQSGGTVVQFGDHGAASLADARRARPQGCEQRGARHDQWDGADAHGSVTELRGPCLFAPGPADPRWPAILADAPQLEPAVRRVADGMANRVDRLRACGNGVVPLVAAFAWRSLAARLSADAGSADAAVRTTRRPTERNSPSNTHETAENGWRPTERNSPPQPARVRAMKETT